MKLRKWVLTAAVAAVASTAVPLTAHAQRYTPYDTYRYYRGRDRDEITRRSALRAELQRVEERVRTAEERGTIGRRRAAEFQNRLDDVRDLLRSERRVSESEYDRWMEDLRDIRGDLRDRRR
jgi:hypothetical protein